jgi:hypothetical protein
MNYDEKFISNSEETKVRNLLESNYNYYDLKILIVNEILKARVINILDYLNDIKIEKELPKMYKSYFESNLFSMDANTYNLPTKEYYRVLEKDSLIDETKYYSRKDLFNLMKDNQISEDKILLDFLGSLDEYPIENKPLLTGLEYSTSAICDPLKNILNNITVLNYPFFTPDREFIILYLKLFEKYFNLVDNDLLDEREKSAIEPLGERCSWMKFLYPSVSIIDNSFHFPLYEKLFWDELTYIRLFSEDINRLFFKDFVNDVITFYGYKNFLKKIIHASIEYNFLSEEILKKMVIIKDLKMNIIIKKANLLEKKKNEYQELNLEYQKKEKTSNSKSRKEKQIEPLTKYSVNPLKKWSDLTLYVDIDSDGDYQTRKGDVDAWEKIYYSITPRRELKLTEKQKNTLFLIYNNRLPKTNAFRKRKERLNKLLIKKFNVKSQINPITSKNEISFRIEEKDFYNQFNEGIGKKEDNPVKFHDTLSEDVTK